jgi:type I restriction-modification system DNA methylase subunit
MKKQTIIESFGFERAVDVNAKRLSNSQREIIEHIKEKEFDIDKIYFSQDDKNSYPAVFIKRVTSFDDAVLKQITDIHKKTWNYKKISFLYVYNDTEIRIYNCIETPIFVTNETNYKEELKKRELASCNQSDQKQLDKLVHIFSSIAIDTGMIWSIEDAIEYREKIKIQQRVDQYLVKSLVETAKKLRKDGLKIELIHRLILRSLFLLYLEDRKATDKKFYAKIKREAKSYFDILEDVDSTYLLFKKLEEHFNGNVFSIEKDEKKNVKKKHLEIIRKCFIHGSEETLFHDWRLFDFSIIQIELLSQIYENFLAEFDSDNKKSSGIFYTPPSLVELILNEKLSVNANEKQYQLKILDPACGSGIFLVESFKRLVKRYENANKGKKLTDFVTLKKLLTDNIFGIEYDGNAIKVAAFSLYLALVDCLDPRTLWQGKKLPNLINDPKDKSLKAQGRNLYKRDTIEENKDIENNSFDLVVGNPPFGIETERRKLPISVRNYCSKHKFASEMVIPFLHKATQFAPKGEIAMIFNTKVLTNTGNTYQRFRKWLMQECYVEKIYNFSILRKSPEDFGGRLFDNAVGPISIAFYKKEQPKNPSSKIVYYAPKTYVKSNILEGIAIDSTDVKYLPREECQKPDTKIWKIAMWGSIADFNLIKKINQLVSSSLGKYFKSDSNWIYGSGLNGDIKHKDFIPENIIETNMIERYYTSKSVVKPNNEYYRKLNKDLFYPPYIALKKGQKNGKTATSLIVHNTYCKSGVFIINNKNKSSIDIKKALVSFINSDIATYFLFLTTASWGIEREQIFLSEYLGLPFFFNNVNMKSMATCFDALIAELQKEIFNEIEIKKGEAKLKEELWKIINMDINDKILIQDMLAYNLNLFEKQQESEALHPVLDTRLYAEMLCSELNEFLEDPELFANVTIYDIDRYNPLCLVKISLEKEKKEVVLSEENINKKLNELDKFLWKENACGIYFRKKLNHSSGDDIFIIRPNQRRFWSQSMAMEDASGLILEILTSEEQ